LLLLPTESELTNLTDFYRFSVVCSGLNSQTLYGSEKAKLYGIPIRDEGLSKKRHNSIVTNLFDN